MYIYIIILGVFTTNLIVGMDEASTSKSPEPTQLSQLLEGNDEFIEVSMTPEQKQLYPRIEKFVVHWSLARDWAYDQVLGWWRSLYGQLVCPMGIEEKKEMFLYLANLMKMHILKEAHYNDMKAAVSEVIEGQEWNATKKNALQKHVDENFIFVKPPSPRERAQTVKARLSRKISSSRIKASKSAILPSRNRKPLTIRRVVSAPSTLEASSSSDSSEKLTDRLRSRMLKKTERIQSAKPAMGVRRIILNE